MGQAFLYDKGLFIIDLYEFFTVSWKALLIALPIWFMYIMFKMKFLECKENW